MGETIQGGSGEVSAANSARSQDHHPPHSGLGRLEVGHGDQRRERDFQHVQHPSQSYEPLDDC
jgi:hypothetical protein